MKRAALALSVVLLSASAARAADADGHWARIQELERTIRDDGGKAYESYVMSLTREQLIEAGRQGSAVLEREDDMGRRGEDKMRDLSFVRHAYPPKSDGVQDLRPLLDEIRSDESPMLWRSFLVKLLTTDWPSWEEHLTIEKCFQVMDFIEQIIVDREAPEEIRETAAEGLTPLLYWTWHLCAESAEPDAMDRLAKTAERQAQVYMALYLDDATPARVRSKFIMAARTYYDLGLASDIVRSAIGKAIAEHRRHGTSLSLGLAYVGMCQMKVDGALEVVKSLLDDKSAGSRSELRALYTMQLWRDRPGGPTDEPRRTENYGWRIVHLRSSRDFAAGQKLNELIWSLDAEQLLLGGRQYGAFIESVAPDGMGWPETMFGFHYWLFCLKAAGDAAPLMREISDKDAPLFWRTYLLAYLGQDEPDEDKVHPEVAAVFNLIDNMELLDLMDGLLDDMEDPLINSGMALDLFADFAGRAYAKEKETGTPQSIQALLTKAEALARKNIRLFVAPDTPATVRRAILSELRRYRDAGIAADECKEAIEQAVRN